MMIMFDPAGKYPDQEAEITAKVNAKVKESYCIHCKSQKWVRFKFDAMGVASIADACCINVCNEVNKAR